MATNKNENEQTPQVVAKEELEALQAKLAEMEKKAAEAEARAQDAEAKNRVAESRLSEIAALEEKKAAAAKAGTVRIKIPLEKNGPKDAQQVFINGRQFIIQRGVEVDVPRGVAEILKNREMMLEVITAFDAANADKG